jgi:glycolate oxidase iron-sulfur subunit
MQTCIPDEILATPEGKIADRILRTCVHCGFCTATCPTYQLLGDELDGPRGRIYLIKKAFEGEQPTTKTLSHLDRCLTCRSCETTCPSGVQYARLLDLGRHLVEQKTSRPFIDSINRHVLHWVLSSPKRFKILYRSARMLNPILPKAMRVSSPETAFIPSPGKHERKVILLQGCVQPAMEPNINAATIRVLDKLGIQAIINQDTVCCGAISHHLNKHSHALRTMRNNIDTWWPQINNGCEAVVSNASGCGITLKEYAQYLEHDSDYSDKARIISERVRDVSEIISDDDINRLKLPKTVRVAFHAPCTLQHGLRLSGLVEDLLTKIGCELLPVTDSYLCCGSAGTYSILQPELSQQLKENKLRNLNIHQPEYILTANIGCQHHLNTNSQVRVMHWIELVDSFI